MYWLQSLTDQVRIAPRFYYQKSVSRQELLKQTINNKLSGRVMLNVGLCVVTWDVISIENNDAFILQSDGFILMNVKFREVIFRPFRDEVLEGKIKEMDETGMLVSLEFFDEVFVSSEQMIEGCVFENGKWVWNYVDEDEGDGEVTKMPMNLEADVRVSVLGVKFYDKSINEVNPENNEPSLVKKIKTENGESAPGKIGGVNLSIKDRMKTSAFVVEASIKGEGFGLLSWW